MNLKYLIAILLIVAIDGCSLLEPAKVDQAGRIAEQRLEDRDAELGALAERNQEARHDPDQPVMDTPARAGSGLVGEVNVGKAISASQAKGEKGKGKAAAVKLEFTDTSLKDIVTVFMQDYLKQPYSFQDSFKDRKVNLFFNARATHEDLIRLFDTLLENYGVKLRYSGGVYLVGSSDDKANPLQQPSPLRVGDAVGVLRLDFVDARDFLTLAKQVAKYPDKITALPGNVLVINSTGTDVRAVQSLQNDVDVPAFAGKYILVYAPRYLSAASLIAMLDSAQTQLAGAQGTTKQFESKQIPDTERVVVVAANKVTRDLVMQLLAQSDVAGGNHRRVFQYPLATQAAADLLPNLTILLKSVIKSPMEVTAVADKASNSLFIYASPEEYAEIRKLLDRMDFRPPAVQIDMVIAEVTLNKSMQYGVEWFLQRTGNLDASLGTFFSSQAVENNTNKALGLTGSLVKGIDKYATLQLLGTETTFSLLSNPKIVVKNGATAKINVGSERPVIKQKTTTNVTGGSTVVEPEFKKIGLEMEVTPYVSANNEVRLVIKLKDTSITGTITLGGTTDSYPILSNREISTDLITADGRTIFLGGIRRQDATDSANKVPGLGDVESPWGALFRDKKMDGTGQELIILATPNIMLDQQGADIITSALLRAARQGMQDIRPPRKKNEEKNDKNDKNDKNENNDKNDKMNEGAPAKSETPS